MFSWPLIRYITTAALRDRLILSVFVLMAVGASLSIFLGSAAVNEADQFAVVFAAGGLRLAGALGLVLFIVFYLRRSFETRDVDYLLARPISRMSFLFSHSLCFMIIAGIITLFVAMAVFAIAPHIIHEGYALWVFSLWVEYVIVANVALFFAMVLPNAAASALAVFAFYVLSRMIGHLIGIADTRLDIAGADMLNATIDLVSLFVPRLDLMAQTTWLIYGSENFSFLFISVQGVLFSFLALMAALVDLLKREF